MIIKELKHKNEQEKERRQRAEERRAFKTPVVKVPGKKISKKEQKNKDRFNRLSLRVPEKSKVVKVPINNKDSVRTKANNSRLSQHYQDLSDIPTDCDTYENSAGKSKYRSAQESPRASKVNVVKKPGIYIRDRRQNQQSSFEDFPSDNENEGHKGSPRREEKPVVRRTSKETLREQRRKEELKRINQVETEEEKQERIQEEQRRLEEQIADLLGRYPAKTRSQERSSEPSPEFKPKKKRDIRTTEHLVNNLRQQKRAAEAYQRKKERGSQNSSRNSNTSQDNSVEQTQNTPESEQRSYHHQQLSVQSSSYEQNVSEISPCEPETTQPRVNASEQHIYHTSLHQTPIYESPEEMQQQGEYDDTGYDVSGGQGYEDQGYQGDQQGGYGGQHEEYGDEQYDNYVSIGLGVCCIPFKILSCSLNNVQI